MNLLNELNEKQREAVEYLSGPQLVIAGAGSGKTRVLTYKIAYLIEKGFMPWTILALTFTNKAANEMKERIATLVGEQSARQLQMGTFHSIFSRILRSEAASIGYQRNFTIYDESDSRSLIKTIVKELQLDDKTYKPASISSRISMAKNMLISSEQYASDSELIERDKRDNIPLVYSIYKVYTQRCLNANCMDFDDLLMNTYRLFKEHEAIRQKYANLFSYILVDEYQDTNSVQQQIVSLLTKEKQHICVVGDDAQSIYGFRGANIDNILNFQKVYPDSKLFKLEQNYRSTQNIVQAANGLIKYNKHQIPKDVYSMQEEGEKLVVKEAASDREEASIVCRDINKIRRKFNEEYKDFAILYRTNSQSRAFEDELRKMQIPYVIYGGLSFYQRKEIKDVIAYFRLVVNPSDEEALRRIINYPTRGIGNTTIQKVIDAARLHNVSLWKVISSPTKYNVSLNKGTITKLSGFVDLIKGFIEQLDKKDAFVLGMQIIKESGITADIFSSTDVEGLSRQENIQEFINSLQEFVDARKEEGEGDSIGLPDFLQQVALLSDSDSSDDTDNKVSLMTIHASKGLEYPNIFIVGLEENIFPSPMMCDSLRKLEEERRLLYVAITRAEKRCTITFAKNRYRFGNVEFNNKSRFVEELDRKHIEFDDNSNAFSSLKHSSYNAMSMQNNSRMNAQNSHPVASQFMADAKPRIVGLRKPEPKVDPFSERFKQRLVKEGGRLVKVNRLINPTSTETKVESTSTSAGELNIGTIIEHQRFGKGKVLQLEGTGENAKATVEFANIGTKQLLLKFAKFTIIG